jgi:enamine deaminase RidA (YjgF/YER057c/UK114 family)
MGKSVNVGVAATIGKYSDAVEIAAGARQLHISGTPGIDKNGIVPESFEEQADLAWRNLVEILRAADMDVGNLVKINQYMVRAEDIAAYPPVRLRYLGEHRPASMLSVVSMLVRPNILFEIEAVASD